MDCVLGDSGVFAGNLEGNAEKRANGGSFRRPASGGNCDYAGTLRTSGEGRVFYGSIAVE